MKNFISLLLILIIITALTFTILHVTRIFIIKDFVLEKLKENPKTVEWFKTHEEVVALSTQIDNLDTVIKNKDQDTQKLLLEIEKLRKEVEKCDQKVESLNGVIQEKENEIDLYNQHLLKIKEMSDIYGEMEPNKAAEILQGMENELIVQIIAVQKKDVVAEILSFFSPDRAALIAKEYTEWEKN
ncbi:MAG: hypothetical protein KAX49_00580 [Halanaerobiales bacterium]|nr:hypothetical protein [Halanaerobiales bacterium]